MADVRAAADRIESHTHRTPVFTSRYLDARTGSAVFLKAENLQKIGAFKARGATNAILSLSEDDAARGVVTHSSGNHGQAVAYACSLRNIAAIVVMPEHAPAVKVDAVRGYGARVVFSTQAERAQTVFRLIDEHGYTEVHPFDNAAVIAGQATATLELVDEVHDLDLVLAPIGGGGLLSGASIVGTEYEVDVIGAEPEVVDDSYRSLRDGVRYPATGAMSVGDGLLVGIGVIPFAILSQANRSVVTVTEDEIIEAVETLAQRTKLVVEPSGATAVAALISHAPLFADKCVGVILSGGNV
jgi:threonine dehydratase